MNFTADEQQQLLAIARMAVAQAAHGHAPLPLPEDGLPEPLQQPAACFVTLHKHGQLRGCIGTLEASEALAAAVARYAAAAAVRDPRFACVQAAELEWLSIEISVLTPPQAWPVASMAELLQALQAGVDGLVIEAGHHRATFLPAVWEHLPQPEGFVDALWRKAGLPPRAWPDALQLWRYRAVTIGAG